MIKILAAFLFIQISVLASSKDEARMLLERFSRVTGTVSRMDQMSTFFLGLPYGDGGPLGEGPLGRFDQDPLYRFDTFDCTTYVETIISLALARDVGEFESQMEEIRYKNGEVDYLKRNHFPSLQWIPFNVENGLLSEINHLITPGHERRMATAIVSYPGWLKSIKVSDLRVPFASEPEKEALLAELHAKAADYVPARAGLDYVPLTYFIQAPERLKAIPHGSIVNFVRPNWDLTHYLGTHMNVSHQGLLFWKKGVLYLRHASTGGERKVVEVSFMDYLKKLENHPTLKGVHFMRANW